MNLGVIHRVALRAENTVNHATSEKITSPFSTIAQSPRSESGSLNLADKLLYYRHLLSHSLAQLPPNDSGVNLFLNNPLHNGGISEAN
jgi:hypothetical protein